MNLKKCGSKILLIAIIFSSLISCKNDKNNTKPQAQVPLEPIHDTLLLEQDTEYVQVPEPYPVVKDSIIYVNNPVDTLAILKMYSEKKFFKDTLRFDYGYIVLNDSISGGSVVSRKFIPKFKVPIKERVQTVKEDPTGNLYLGINAGLDKPNYVHSLGTSLIYQTPNKMLYEIGIGVLNRTSDGINGEFVPYIHGGAYWKIGSKSKK
jgi:hypothetical protein